MIVVCVYQTHRDTVGDGASTSRNQSTLARDLFVLSKNGYRIKKVQPVDMFPGTGHVECVVMLDKRTGL